MEQECIWEYHNMGGVHMSINKKVLNSISDHSDIKGVLFGHNIKFLLGHMNNIFANLKKKKVNLVIFDILGNNNCTLIDDKLKLRNFCCIYCSFLFGIQ